jgi:hypothetical protein
LTDISMNPYGTSLYIEPQVQLRSFFSLRKFDKLITSEERSFFFSHYTTTIEVLEYIMDTPNIELLAKNDFDKQIAFHMWVPNGGLPTLKGFEKRSKEQQKGIVNYLIQLILYRIVDNFLLVHCGIDMVHSECIVI